LTFQKLEVQLLLGYKICKQGIFAGVVDEVVYIELKNALYVLGTLLVWHLDFREVKELIPV
jgi:hypothetical protein